MDKQTSKDGKDKEIPIPEIRAVSTYEQDYRPNYRKSTTYLRGATFGAPPPETVEYDLDNDDEDWLEKYNDGQNRLPAEKLENHDVEGAFYTLVPIRPRSRGGRRSLRTFAGVSLRPPLAFNPRPSAPFNSN